MATKRKPNPKALTLHREVALTLKSVLRNASEVFDPTTNDGFVPDETLKEKLAIIQDAAARHLSTAPEDLDLDDDSMLKSVQNAYVEIMNSYQAHMRALIESLKRQLSAAAAKPRRPRIARKTRHLRAVR